MASYKKTKTGWSVRVSRRENGKLKQVYKAGFATKNEAKAFAQGIESEDSIGKKREKTFADYFTEWHETYKSGKVAPSTYRKYLHVDKILHDHFPDTTLSDMNRQKYQRFLNDFGADHSKEMMSEISIYVRGCVKSALYDELIKKDFTIGAELAYDRTKTRQIEYLNFNEIQTLIQTAIENLDPRYTSLYMIITAIYTGARLGEIAGLTWKDIDFMHQTISINKSYSYVQRELKETKSKASNRVIAVNSGLLTILKQLRSNGNIMVFANQRGEIPTSNAVNKALRKLMSKSGLNKAGYHFHSLRHSHVAYLLYQGVDLYAISKRLGHSDLTITMKKYAYLMQEYEAEQNKSIATKLQQLQDF